MLRIELDTSGVESAAKDAAARLEAGFPKAMEEAGKILAASVDENFLTSGTESGGAYTALADRTIAGRERRQRRGGKIVADIDTPLRETDALRLAATSTRTGHAGSAYDVGGTFAQVGVDLETFPYARALNEGNSDKRIPARPFLELDSAREEEITDLLTDAATDAVREAFGN